MKKYVNILTVIFIITALLLLWGDIYFSRITGISRYGFMRILVWLFIMSFTLGATWFLYRKEWHDVLGFKTKGITKGIIWKAIGTGLLISFGCSIFVNIAYFIIFREPPMSPFGDINKIELIFWALILAPIVEELLFRGFIQGLWQKLYSNKEKPPTKLIIVVIALLFALSHFGFLFNITVKQFFFSITPIFVGALYIGRLRYKYQSIIPSMFAHFGFNLPAAVGVIFTVIMSFVLPDNDMFSEFKKGKAQYENDTTGYNFDPNDMDEWKKSFTKFCILEKQQSAELTKHLKGQSIGIGVYFTIDTCGNIYNIYTHAEQDSIYYSIYRYDFSDEAIKFIQSLPQCKPYMIDGKKEEKLMWDFVPFY